MASLDSTLLPQHLVNIMDKKDRAALGKKGRTTEEIDAKILFKRETEFQGQIRNLLNQNGIEFINPPMNKKSGLPIGWPDFTCCINGHAVGIEAKIPGEKPRPTQDLCHEKMKKNGWKIHVVTSLDQVREIISRYRF